MVTFQLQPAVVTIPAQQQLTPPAVPISVKFDVIMMDSRFEATLVIFTVIHANMKGIPLSKHTFSVIKWRGTGKNCDKHLQKKVFAKVMIITCNYKN